MAIIGTFIKQADGSYLGTIRTLRLDIGTAALRPTENTEPKTPDFRLYAGEVECGAGWKRTSRDNRGYVSVKLDDPTFPVPVYATLVDADEGYGLIWSRSRAAD